MIRKRSTIILKGKLGDFLMQQKEKEEEFYESFQKSP